MSYDLFSPKYQAYIALIYSYIEPSTYTQAKDHFELVEAMRVELDALERTNTWTIQDIPSENKLIGCR